MTLSQYNNKSVLLLESARILGEKEYPVAIPHCAYYSCYQLLMSIWIDIMGKTDAELKQLVDAAQAERFDKGSHNVLIKEIVKYIKSDGSDKGRVQDSSKINTDLQQLKSLRHKADYKDRIIDINTGKKSIDLAEKLIPLLKKYMKP